MTDVVGGGDDAADGARASDAVSRILGVTATEAAPRLLGAVLRHTSPEGTVAVRLTEVEAYEGEHDPGSHAFRGVTPRTAPMFAAAGHAYVYQSYGMHVCCNLVCSAAGIASGCLLRAGEVVQGEELARARRAAARRAGAPPLRAVELARGPGNLARALGIGLDASGRRVDAAPFELVPPSRPVPVERVARGLRVGLAAPGGLDPFHWRWWIDGDPTVSRYTPHRSVRDAGR